MGVFIAATRATFRPCMGLLSARCSSSGGSTWRLQSAWKLLANLTFISLNIPLGKWKRGPREFKTSRRPEIKLLQWTVTLISFHSQWNEGQYHVSEDCNCPHRLGCCVSLNVVGIKPIDVCFLIFARRSPCQQISLYYQLTLYRTYKVISTAQNFKPISKHTMFLAPGQQCISVTFCLLLSNGHSIGFCVWFKNKFCQHLH